MDELTPDEVKAIVAEIEAWHAGFVEPEKWRITAIEHFYDMPIECYQVNFVSGLATVYMRNEKGLLRPALAFTYQAPDFDRAKQREEAQ